jgi:DUF4097 and DUF4098 domain-containing protein YvlB
MPRFDTAGPIDLAINLQVGAIEVIAGDRTDTLVTASPTNPAKAVDRRGADETAIHFDGERLTVVGPRPRLAFIGPTESVDLRIEVPAGTRLTAELAVGGVRTTGRLGATRIKSSTGAVELDGVGDLWLRVALGSATVGTVDGSAEITADHGQIRVDAVTGDATFKASHGSILIGRAGGEVDAKLSYGDLEITAALASVRAKTAYGNIRIGEVSSGSIELESAYGLITAGVRHGVLAWLDLSSKNGRVRNQLDGDRAPEASESTVAIRARTQSGDIDIRRA